jgi:hypothetical protein
MSLAGLSPATRVALTGGSVRFRFSACELHRQLVNVLDDGLEVDDRLDGNVEVGRIVCNIGEVFTSLYETSNGVRQNPHRRPNHIAERDTIPRHTESRYAPEASRPSRNRHDVRAHHRAADARRRGHRRCQGRRLGISGDKPSDQVGRIVVKSSDVHVEIPTQLAPRSVFLPTTFTQSRRDNREEAAL